MSTQCKELAGLVPVGVGLPAHPERASLKQGGGHYVPRVPCASPSPSGGGLIQARTPLLPSTCSRIFPARQGRASLLTTYNLDCQFQFVRAPHKG